MATSGELAELYGELRAAVLSRHFAIGRYFRANQLSLFNVLGSLRDAESQRPPDTDDIELGCDAQRVRSGTYTSAADLLTKSRAIQEAERWRVADHGRENPLMYSSLLLICLAVEHRLGHKESGSILREALRSIGSLYKFGGDFRGYPVRWDEVTSDRWVTRSDAGRPKLRYPCEFLIRNDRASYLYCTPFQDPRYTPYIRNREFRKMSKEQKEDYIKERHRSLNMHRSWEPSTDELVGLVCLYDITYRLVDDPGIREEVRQQTNRLGSYLAAHGYLLVRPSGGFTARGASGILPALEFPFQRVFERITGNPYAPTVGFEGALGKAEMWGYFEGPLFWATLAGSAVSISIGSLALLGGSPLGVILPIAFGAMAAFPAVIFARALAFYLHRECFDVWSWPYDESSGFDRPKDDHQAEFVGAYLLKKLPQAMRFKLWCGMTGWMGRGWSAWFPAYLGLTGLSDTDDTVRQAYLDFLPGRRKHPDLDARAFHDVERYNANPFASAVAVVLGAGADEEEKLVELLNRWYDHIIGTSRDLEITDSGDESIENFRPALYYMAALALAWLHAKKKEDAGEQPPTAPGFPVAPGAVNHFPSPAVPPSVLDAVQVGEMLLPDDTWGTDEFPPATGELFGDGVYSKRPNAAAPALDPSAGKQLDVDVTVRVTEADYEVDTGVDLRSEDEYVIEAAGKIWAGVWLTGDNGPEGWKSIDHDLKFPVHGRPGGHPYALIGRLGIGGGYFLIGRRFPHDDPDRMLHLGTTRRLFLRTNDDAPGNGSKREKGKYFDCRIQVWRRIP
jgi:hypothetical protein